MKQIVVVGAGQAGASLAAKLRAEGYDGAITLIGAEGQPPYQRPPLSKAYLLGEMDRDRLYLRPAAWYAENGIDLALGQSAAGIDRERARVKLSTGESLAYDALALCTGSDPIALSSAIGGDLDGIHLMRTLDDADALAPEMAPGRRVLIVGGGYIGLEAAAVAAKRRLKVTLVEAADRILSRVAAPQTSDYFRALHRGHGVDLRESTGLVRFAGSGRVAAAQLSDGTTIEIDFAIVGVGIRPATSLAEAAGLAIDNGIATDACGRTSDPAIWAAGDCASFPRGAGRIRLESVGNAIDMAEAVARNMLGAEEPYRARPWFWSDQYDIKLQIAGLNTGYDAVVVREAGPAQSHWYFADGALIAVDAMNDPRGYMIGKRLIESGKSAPPEWLADPSTNLKGLLTA